MLESTRMSEQAKVLFADAVRSLGGEFHTKVDWQVVRQLAVNLSLVVNGIKIVDSKGYFAEFPDGVTIQARFDLSNDGCAVTRTYWLITGPSHTQFSFGEGAPGQALLRKVVEQLGLDDSKSFPLAERLVTLPIPPWVSVENIDYPGGNLVSTLITEGEAASLWQQFVTANPLAT